MSSSSTLHASNNNIIGIVGYEIGIPQISDDTLCSAEKMKVLRFTEPVNALEHFKTNREDYALIISDLRMPVINGMQLLKTVKDLNPLARTVLTTDFDYDSKLIEDYAKKQIINGLLQKPIQPHQLITEVEKQIDTIKSINKK
ncbi:MAG TPA: response regulator [Nitrososphaeraceae archaeon]|nr:response regulator [Nitrososphaeraceae archaeon]